MARPQILQRLSHGKLLTKMNFPNYVDSWNYIITRCDNLKGDADVYHDGHIKVDDSDPEHPVIRFIGSSSSSQIDLTALNDVVFVSDLSLEDVEDVEGAKVLRVYMKKFQVTEQTDSVTVTVADEEPKDIETIRLQDILI